MSINITYMCKGVLKFILTVCFLVGSQVFLYAEIFAPFVSGLSADAENNSVTLTWKRAPSEIKVYEIYRSTTAFSEESFESAVFVGSVSHEISVYTDYPPTTEKYYYAVLGKKDDSTLYKLFIPYRNITVAPVAVETTDSIEAVAATISGISATATDDSVDVQFQSSKPNREVIIYRSSTTILDQQDLIDASAIATITSAKQEYIDYPLGGIPYYYAVLDAELAKAGAFDFISGKNTLTDPVELPVGSQVISRDTSVKNRITPLPYLFINSSVFGNKRSEYISTINFSEAPKQLSSDISTIWSRLDKKLSPSKSKDKPVPDILPSDRKTEASSNESQLSKVIHRSFPDDPGNRLAWQNAEKQLASFFNISRTKEVLTRAHYYMGQVYFFQGKYKEAFFEFIMAHDALYSEVQIWLERIYPHLPL